MATPTKITDYFPPSPTREDGEKDEVKQSPAEINVKEGPTKKSDDSHKSLTESTPVKKAEDSLQKSLVGSSVIITPNPSPHKDENQTISESTSGKPENKEENHKKGETVNKTSVPACKKPEQKSTENEVKQQPTKSKRKGRRKKRDTKTEPPITGSPTVNGPAKPKSARKKPTESTETKNTLLTDFFPVRRSDRKCKNEIEKEKTEALQYKILNHVEDGLEVQDIENKGRGVVATKPFKKGEFVVEYAGDLIDLKEAKDRDEEYSKDPSKGCYMYYFNFQNKKYCIDATAESGKLGRLLNHSKTSGNCHTKTVGIKDQPYLILVASRDISVGEELLYDYGDRSKSSLESHPWLKS